MLSDLDADKQPKMSLIEQILDWSEEALVEWQKDALRRLFQRGSEQLTERDYAELYELMKKENGLGGHAKLTPEVWSKEHIPTSTSGAGFTVLRAIRDLSNVNRIAGRQTLTFATDGLTIVYGGNGSGKSGYSRVLKRACRARDQSEPIHTDATDASQTGKVPEATFDIEIGGKLQTVSWAMDRPSPEELSTIAVFDGRCARAYLTSEGDVAYIPYGLDILGSLANVVLPNLEKKLAAEIAATDVDPAVLDPLRGDTKVGALVAAFGPNTNESDVRELAAMTADEDNRLVELQKALAEEDPREAARKLRLEGQRLTELIKRITAGMDLVCDEVLLKCREVDEKRVEAEKVVVIAAQSLRSGESLLPGTGEKLWRQMFEAAKRYSVEAAYRAHDFPHTDDGAVCPLCQQELGSAGDRLKRFLAYLEADAAKKLETANREVTAASDELGRTVMTFGLDEALEVELEALETGLAERVTGSQIALDQRRKAILQAMATHEWDGVPAIDADVRAELQRHALLLGERADAMEKASDAEKRALLVAERAELHARNTLKGELSRVIKLLTNLKKKAGLEGCRKDLKTAGISAKAKALSESAVTIALREALDDEFSKLGGVPFKLRLADRNEKGRTKYKLKMAAGSADKLEEILSEGEQRAVTIGSFLAEIGVAGHSGGIVFDDPVSSLDHARKTCIASRLAAEAKARQVIVFTHDLPFLSLLQSEAESIATPCCAHWLEKSNDGWSGKVKLNDSPYGEKKYRDTKLANETIKKAETVAGEERVSLLRHAAGQLRRTLEEVVQHHLFKKVVERWRENLMMTKLPEVKWDDKLADEITSAFEDLSRHIEGHSHSDAYAGGVPEVNDLKKLADRVDAIIKEAKKSRE